MQNLTLPSLTGHELKAIRRAKGISQTVMAERIGCSRASVSNWERKPGQIKTHWGVPSRMLKELGVNVLPINLLSPRVRGHGVLGAGMTSKQTSTRTQGGGVLALSDRGTLARGGGLLDSAAQNALDRECARINAKLEAEAARYRQPCGARTRKNNGAPCRNMSEPGRRRCRFHGGKSTGPKTAEGRSRIAEAQRVRWAAHRAARAVRDALVDCQGLDEPKFRLSGFLDPYKET